MPLTSAGMKPWRGIVAAVGLALFAGLIRTHKASRYSQPSRQTFTLAEISQKIGIRHVHTKLTPHPSLANIAPWISSIGASVAVVDFDDDGWPDVYLTNSEKGSRNSLFHNNHDGTFSDVSTRSGIGDVNQTAGSLRALFFDYDNDGKKDLLLTTHHCVKLFHNKGDGLFQDVTAASGLHHCGISYASNVFDYDGDGFLDVIIADYNKPVDLLNPADYRFLRNSMTHADNGGPIDVFHNNGNGTFTRVPDSLGIKSRGWTLAIGVHDLGGRTRQDRGHQDLYFATDYGPDQVYLNQGRGKFLNASAKVRSGYSPFNMNAEIADLDDDGRPVVMVTNIYTPPYALGGNALWKTDDGDYRNVAKERGVQRCGWAWGAKFIDLDNDSFLDLVITNGFISANSKKDYLYQKGVLDGSAGVIMEDARSWPPMKDFSVAGYEKKCIYRNIGGTFEEVTEQTSLKDDLSDGRGLAAIDFLNNGSLSFVEANQGQPARFYRVDQKNSNHWIGFKLVGTRSNRDALGAKVRLHLGNRTLTRELEPANGFMSQSDARLHFGLGPNPSLGDIVVEWPSGQKQILRHMALDRYHLVREPRE